MAPTPQEAVVVSEIPSGADGERVVIAGMSGLYPNAEHVKDLERILYEKKNPITDEQCRWKFMHPELRNQAGKVPGLTKFDGQFFKVHYRMGNSMDSMGRKLLEQSYQAIYDAGVCPSSLSGKKIGVYMGSCFSETEKACFYVASSRTGFGIAGCSKSMFANRISYALNAKGPSMSCDEACCSSMVALEQAYLAISRGECEAAVVGGAHLSLHPQSTVHCGRIIDLAPDGKTKSFDQNADGCAKSEAINVLFLQKAKNARRIYAEIIHTRTEFVGMVEGDGGPKYGFYRDPTLTAGFMQRFYEEAKVPPQAVEYVEAFGSGVPEADKSELEAIEQVFCKDRTAPLLVGSVMSNIGYGEAASGISAITKVLLGYQKGEIAGNLHLEKPRQDIAAIREGKMEILGDHKKFGRTLTAVNQISVTGCSAHALLHGHYKPKDLNRYKCNIPRLVTVSARQDTAAHKILQDLKCRPVDAEEHALFHHINETREPGHVGRGYVILDTNEEGRTICLAETSSYFDDATRPLWFVYSGMGSQWAGMGTSLMRIPIFAAAIEKCRKALEPKGIDIVHIITSTDKTIFDNILHSFVGIAAVQIGLTDVLTSLGIKPDNIIGHSVGELGCAYADGCFTAEEMILSAYSRGLVSVQTPFIRGSMAAVGIGFNQIKNMVPPEIEVACHNGPESSTISGPADKMKEFVAELTAKGIFAKEVPCSNIAYHSRYIADAGPGLLKYLSEVIKDPKPRSDRWVSSSVPKDKWNEPRAKYSSAEYHTNNLLSPVLFEETSRLIPANAVCVEIAPHALLQAILKRSLDESVKNIPLTRRGHTDNAFMVLDAVGKLYMEGFNPLVKNLYPKVEFPVSTGTPMLSHLIEWAHHENWSVPLYKNAYRKLASSCKFIISPHDDEYAYLRGHVIRGRNSYPFAAALVAVWDTLTMFLSGQRKSASVEFRDLQLFSQPTLHDKIPLRLRVALQRATGKFEILDEDRKLVAGTIKTELFETNRAFKRTFETTETMELTTDDVYQMLHERDYHYTGDFKTIQKANKSFTEAEVAFRNNWVTYLDGIIQLHFLRDSHESVSQLLQIRRICIDLEEHQKALTKAEAEGKGITAQWFEVHETLRCGGVLMENVQFTRLPTVDDPVSLKISKFVPRFKPSIDTVSALQVYLQTVAENINKDNINVLGIMNSKEELPISEGLKAVLNDIPGVTVHYEQMRREKVLVMRDQFLTEVDLVLVQNLANDDNLCQMLYRVLRRDSFLINGEENADERIRPSTLFRVVSSHIHNNQKLDLVKWRPTQANAASTVVTCRDPSELVLLKGTREQLPQRHKLVILASYPPVPGLKNLVKKWRKEADKNQVYLIMVSDKDGLDQLPELDLAYNALVNGVWGSEYYTAYQERMSVDRGVTLRSSRIGHLDSLHWAEAGEPTGPGVAVNVHYASVGVKDMKVASGLFSFASDKVKAYGMDFSGVTDNGERVMGLMASGSCSSRIRARPELMWPVPAHWSLEDAVTVPSAYAHAFYIYTMKVQFCRGYTVLVHGASGALGQAAVAVALAHGAEVFATVSDVSKKSFLIKLFPQIKEENIGNSRDATFGDMVRSATNDLGCNIVVSCLKGDLKNVSLNCLSACGILVDTEQLPSQEHYSFGMHYLTRERNYKPIDFTSLILDNNVEDMRKLQTLISDGIARGYVRPLSRMTYMPDEVPRAFRLLAASRHRGRVVINLQDKVTVAEPRITCSPDLTHVVLCDEQSVGMQLAQRLVERGARKLRLHTANPSKNLEIRVQSWKSEGIKVKVSAEDLSNNKGIISLLTESNALGPVEGIYFIATDASENNVVKLTGVLANLDLAARKLCPSVRYFAIVNAGLNVGQQTCQARARDGIPVTQLNIPALRKPDAIDQAAGGALSWRGALIALERALRSSQHTLLAYPQQVARPSLLQQLANIADIEIPEDTMDHVTLLDLGMELAKLPAISYFLKNLKNIVLPDDSIPELTVQKIRELDDLVNGPVYPDIRGLDTFYSYIDPDEMAATTDLAFLPTLTNCHRTTRADEFDVSQTYLCLIPGLEGHHLRFQILCERVKLPALILQPGLDYPHETDNELAHRYAKILMEKAKLRDNFYLLGYESGVSTALEVAAILEEHGLTGTVFCLGNTPSEFRWAVNRVLGEHITDADLQNVVIKYMYKLMTGNDEGIEKAVQNVADWKGKVEACVRMLLGKVAHSAQYARNTLEGAYTKLVQAKNYTVHPKKLKSKLVLLHASDLSSDSGISPEQDLQRFSVQAVAVHELMEPLAHATKDLRCSNIINKYVQPEILTAFDESNRCEQYLLNAEEFMMNIADVKED